MTLYQNILMWVSLAAAFALAAAGIVVWCDMREVLPGRRILHAFMRLPWLVRLFLVAFVVQLVVHGSTKTNVANGVEGGTTNAPTMMTGVLWAGVGGPRGRGPNGVVQPEEGRVPVGAVLAQEQWRRGCWEDWLSVSFDEGWVFPHGTNHLSRVAVMTQGELRSTVRDTDAVASLGAKVAHVPFDTCFYHELTLSNSYRFTWDRAYVDRNTNMPMYAVIELFRNGDISVSTNGVATFTPREIPFPHIGIGQNDEWVRANFSNATEILSVGYANWVDAQIGHDVTNGLYRFSVILAEDLPEVSCIRVGALSVATASAGTYSFVLRKGETYEFGVWPYTESVSYSWMDDLAGESSSILGLPRMASSFAPSGSFTQVRSRVESADESEIISPQEENWLGSIRIDPLPFISPAETTIPAGHEDDPLSFSAGFNDIPLGVTPHVKWTDQDGRVLGLSDFLLLTQGVEDLSRIDVEITFGDVRRTGCIVFQKRYTESQVALTGVGTMICEDAYTNAPGEVVEARTGAFQLTADWQTAEAGSLTLTSSCGTSVRVFDELGSEVSLPYNWSADAHELDALSFTVRRRDASPFGPVGELTLTFAGVGGTVRSSTLPVAAYKIRVEADADWPSNKVRHVFGPKEKACVSVSGADSSWLLTGVLPDHGSIQREADGWKFTSPDQPGTFTVNAMIDGVSLPIALRCVGPASVHAESMRPWSSNEWLEQGVPPFASTEPGVTVFIQTYLEPQYVSLEHVRLFEEYAPPIFRQGWYQDLDLFPDSCLAHSSEAGASADPSSSYAPVGNANRIVGGDYVGGWIGGNFSAFTNGSFCLNIPMSWYTVGCSVTNRFAHNEQKFWIYENGSMRVRKYGVSWQRDLDGLEYEPGGEE